MIDADKIMQLVGKAVEVLECEDNDCEKCDFIKLCDSLCNLSRTLEVYLRDRNERNARIVNEKS